MLVTNLFVLQTESFKNIYSHAVKWTMFTCAVTQSSHLTASQGGEAFRDHTEGSRFYIIIITSALLLWTVKDDKCEIIVLLSWFNSGRGSQEHAGEIKYLIEYQNILFQRLFHVFRVKNMSNRNFVPSSTWIKRKPSKQLRNNTKEI